MAFLASQAQVAVAEIGVVKMEGSRRAVTATVDQRSVSVSTHPTKTAVAEDEPVAERVGKRRANGRTSRSDYGSSDASSVVTDDATVENEVPKKKRVVQENTDDEPVVVREEGFESSVAGSEDENPSPPWFFVMLLLATAATLGTEKGRDALAALRYKARLAASEYAKSAKAETPMDVPRVAQGVLNDFINEASSALNEASTVLGPALNEASSVLGLTSNANQEVKQGMLTAAINEASSDSVLGFMANESEEVSADQEPVPQLLDQRLVEESVAPAAADDDEGLL